MIRLDRLPEELLLAMLGWGEARGEKPIGILAVQWVAKNRSDGENRALKDVILQPYQFSCFNERDPNRDKLFGAHHLDPENWGMAVCCAKLLLDGLTMDPTGGATHYYAVSIPTPEWADPASGWVELVQIGHHIFGTLTHATQGSPSRSPTPPV